MLAKAALGPAPEVVREPERRDRRDRRHREPDDRADERQAQPAEAPTLRSERREQEVTELTTAMDEPADVAAGRAVLEVELDLRDAKAGAGGVDRHPRLDAEAGRDGKELRAGRAREAALTGERLADAKPPAPATSARATDFAIPSPPPARCAKTRSRGRLRPGRAA